MFSNGYLRKKIKVKRETYKPGFKEKATEGEQFLSNI